MNDSIKSLLTQFEQDNDCTVIYVTKSGSHLYGTSTPISDTDYLGLFLPSKRSLLLKTAPEHLVFTTGSSGSKNTVDDIDITLWSVHKFLSQLVNGETGAYDLLFSMNGTPELFTPTSTTIRDYALKHLLSKNVNSFIAFALGQSERYGIKGSRYKELYTFTTWLGNTLKRMHPNYGDLTIANQMGILVNHIDNNKYKYIKLVRAPGPKGGNQHELVDYLEVLDKKHANTVAMATLLSRIIHKLDYAGNRTKAAMDGTDWKSLSSAVRVIKEVQELLTTGAITFPLVHANYIRDIKLGKVLPEYIMVELQNDIDEIELLLEASTLPEHIPMVFAYDLLLQLYKE